MACLPRQTAFSLFMRLPGFFATSKTEGARVGAPVGRTVGASQNSVAIAGARGCSAQVTLSG